MMLPSGAAVKLNSRDAGEREREREREKVRDGERVHERGRVKVLADCCRFILHFTLEDQRVKLTRSHKNPYKC